MARFYVRAAAAMLALAACTGVLMRFGLVHGMPAWAANYTAIRHAHSHLMYFGWVTLGIMALVWVYLPRLTARPLPRGVAVQMAASALLALLSYPAFWINGYQTTRIGSADLPLGSMAAGLNGLTWFVFIALYARATRGLATRPLALRLWDWAIVLLLLSALGAFGIAGVVLVGGPVADYQPFFLHLFLDLFAVGWFGMGVLGILWARLGAHAPPAGWLPAASLAVALAPTFMLGMPPGTVTTGMYWLAALANLVAAGLLGVHLLRLFQRRTELPSLARYAILILALHILSALAVLVPGFWRWSGGTQLRIFYLHNFLLAWISSALLGVILAEFGARRRLIAWVQPLWIVGVSAMLLALLGAGFVQFTPIAIIEWWRMAAWASVLVAGAALLAVCSLLGGQPDPDPRAGP